MIGNIGHDYYTINAVDQAALLLQLRAFANTRADLVTATGKGFRPPGTRNPHSWTIVDDGFVAFRAVNEIITPRKQTTDRVF
jgi:hypothetical protein